jgi:hypothetical protein
VIVKGYLPEALFFVPLIVVLSVMRLDAFGDVPEFLFVVVFGCLALPYGAVASALIAPALAFGVRRGGAVAAAPALGFALIFGVFILAFFFYVLSTSPTIPELYWTGLWVAPVASAVFFVVERIRADRKTAFAYAVGVLLLAVAWFVIPWISDVALVLVQGPSLRAELDGSQGRKHLVTFDYSYGFLDSPTRDLIYDRVDATTEAVMKRYQATYFAKCTIVGKRVIGYYYTARVDCE